MEDIEPNVLGFLSGGGVDKIELTKEEVTIGRGEANDIVIENRSVSQNHALLRFQSPTRAFLRDLKSTNGTMVNEKRVKGESILLNDGDVVKFGYSPGSFMFKYVNKSKWGKKEERRAPTETKKIPHSLYIPSATGITVKSGDELGDDEANAEYFHEEEEGEEEEEEDGKELERENNERNQLQHQPPHSSPPQPDPSKSFKQLYESNPVDVSADISHMRPPEIPASHSHPNRGDMNYFLDDGDLKRMEETMESVHRIEKMVKSYFQESSKFAQSLEKCQRIEELVKELEYDPAIKTTKIEDNPKQSDLKQYEEGEEDRDEFDRPFSGDKSRMAGSFRASFTSYANPSSSSPVRSSSSGTMERHHYLIHGLRESCQSLEDAFKSIGELKKDERVEISTALKRTMAGSSHAILKNLSVPPPEPIVYSLEQQQPSISGYQFPSELPNGAEMGHDSQLSPGIMAAPSSLASYFSSMLIEQQREIVQLKNKLLQHPQIAPQSHDIILLKQQVKTLKARENAAYEHAHKHLGSSVQKLTETIIRLEREKIDTHERLKELEDALVIERMERRDVESKNKALADTQEEITKLAEKEVTEARHQLSDLRDRLFKAASLAHSDPSRSCSMSGVSLIESIRTMEHQLEEKCELVHKLYAENNQLRNSLASLSTSDDVKDIYQMKARCEVLRASASFEERERMSQQLEREIERREEVEEQVKTMAENIDLLKTTGSMMEKDKAIQVLACLCSLLISDKR
ncbi:hypothetical protein ADUPG1_000448 [Aduncisulcus paluster]|uniref:FHA domain-containing protein n=1 Tax=Aduncisulcus paluster TaxID=2918883 RepID=A0ABQ5K6D3_9EUKA|nr:hypothetical protein ADUPG1_000448 [Aduncisulcus paluster]